MVSGDQQDAYSSSGLTYDVKACTKVGGSLETKHLCIKFASLCARVTIWFTCICTSNFRWLLVHGQV